MRRRLRHRPITQQMQRDGAAWPPTGIGVRAMPGKGMVKMNVASRDRTQHAADFLGGSLMRNSARQPSAKTVLIMIRATIGDGMQIVDAISPALVLCIEPGIPHFFALAPGTKAGHMAGVHLECAPGRWLDGDYRLDPAPQCLTAVAAAEIDLIQRCAVIYAGDHRYRQTLCNTLATTLLVLLAARWTGITPGTSAPERLQDMLAYLRQHAVRGCTRNDLAQAFACTPEHINWLFRQHLGTTPGLAVQRERCRIAYDLLHQYAASVTTAATAAGYADPFHFSRVFRRIYGVAPSQVR